MASNNNANYVSAAKPAIEGAIYRAPTTASLPTTADESLDAAFKCLGYISEDGVTNSNSRESDSFKAWGGDTVLNSQTSYTDTFNYKLLEVLNVEVLKTVFGDENVTGDLQSGIHVRANSKELPSSAWVIDTILRDDTLNRLVIPNGKISEVGEITYASNNPIAYGLTITAFPDSGGDTHHEYKKASPIITT